MNFGISFIIDVLKLSNWVGTRILFLVSLEWIHFNHLVSTLPENVDSGVVVDRNYYSELKFFLGAFFIGWELKSRDFIGLDDLALLADLPGMQ